MMNRGSSPLHQARRHRRGLALASLIAFVWLLLLSASAALHHEVHEDAPAADHHCAVTLISSGQVDASPLVAPVTPPVAVFLSSLPRSQAQVIAADLRLMPERGPPVSR
jgi:hypothetical protein